MQNKTSQVMSPLEKPHRIQAPDNTQIPYALCFEDAPIGAAITTADGKVLHLNKALLSLTGYSREESSRIDVAHLYKNPEERGRFISRLQKEKTLNKYEMELVRKDGYPIQISVTSALISLGQKEAILSMVEDVTGNRRLERELTIHEQATATSISAIAMTDLNGKLNYANTACLRMWGYDEPTQVLGKAVTSFSQSREEASRIIAEVLKKGWWEGELVAKRADNTTFDVQLAANVVGDKEGNPIRLMASFVDISERKRVERALQDSERQYRMVLDAMGDAITLVDRDLRITLANKIIKEWCIGLGVSAEIEGLSLFDAFPFLHEEKVREEYARVFDTGETITTQESIINHEKEIVTETRKSPVFEEGRVIRVLAAIRDVTEKSRLEKALIGSEKKYRHIFENTLVGIYQSTFEGRYISANPAIAKMFGYETPETFMACITDIGKQLYVNPSDRERSMQVLKGSDRLESFEVQTRRRDGSLMWSLINSRPVRGKDGRIQYIEGVIIDATKLKQTEEALRSSQERFSKAFRSSPAPMVISTLNDGRFIDVNRRFLDMLEYNRDELIGRTSEELEIWENPEQRHFDVAWLRQNGSLRGKPVRFRTKKGGYRDALWSAEIITIDGGQHMLSLIYDITEHKKTEQELRESQRRLADIIDFLPDATFVIDRSGTVIAWNRAMEEMTGVPSSEMIGNSNYEYAIYFYGEKRPILIDLILNNHDILENKYRFLKREKDRIIAETDVNVRGRKRMLWATAAPIFNTQGEIVGAIESIRDTTDRRKAEEALIDSEARLRAIIDSAPDAIFIKDRENRFVLVNKVFPTQFNIPKDKIIGKTYEELFGDTLAGRIREGDERVLAGEIVEIEVERSGSGTPRMFNVIKAPLRNHLGEIIGICGIGRDITDRRSLEAQLFQSQKMEAIGTLAGGIAHDFNNILTAIIGFSELSIEEITGNHPLRENLGQILNAGLRARSLVGQILTFSRQGEVDIGPVMPAPLVKEAVKMLRASLPSTIRIKHHIQSPMDTIKADATQLYQVIMNLATNAADAMRDTAGTLEIRVERVDVTQETPELSVHLSPGNYVRLAVKDSGIGMDRATKDRIFEPFFTTKPKGKGTGLGLSVVYGIVKSHKGAILVDSEPGEGTTFHAYFPRLQEKESVKKEGPRDIPGGTEHILFVDDEAMVAEAAQKLLEKLGYKVTMRTGSVDALEAFRAQPARYDLVISDVTMPNMTGPELTRQLLNIRPGMPIILCTGFSELIDDEEMKALGIRAFIMKPVTYRDLAGTVRQVLDAG